VLWTVIPALVLAGEFYHLSQLRMGYGQISGRCLVVRVRRSPVQHLVSDLRLRGGMFGVQKIGIQRQAIQRYVIPFNSVPGHHHSSIGDIVTGVFTPVLAKH